MTDSVDAWPRLRLLLATGLGAGYGPIAPGTWGSLLGVALHVALVKAGGWPAAIAGTALASALGMWSAGAAARRLGASDPGPVVIDEIAGQLLTLLFLPLTPATLLAGFLVFRALDVVKPFPARRLEALPGASGIMADDLVAGVYANLLVRAGLLVIAAF